MLTIEVGTNYEYAHEVMKTKHTFDYVDDEPAAAERCPNPLTPPPPLPRSLEQLCDCEDLLREIFLRLPPHDRRGLIRAAAGCKRWRSLISGATFADEYRAFRRAPSMLGFLYGESVIEPFEPHGQLNEIYWVSHFVSTAPIRPQACEDLRDWRVLDSRHGLVLFYTPTVDSEFVVRDLVTGDQWVIDADADCEGIMCWPDDDALYMFDYMRCNAAVLCSGHRCDHFDCHGGSFRVALVGSDEHGLEAFATVYSSETKEWSKLISVKNPNRIDRIRHSAVVGNKDQNQPYLELMGVEDGMLLFASMVAGPSRTAGWARRRVVDLQPLLPSAVLKETSKVSKVLPVGFAEGVGVIFLRTNDGLYRIDINSGESEFALDTWIEKVTPYMSSYTEGTN
ncbi:unnamed protein product [Alopecurus aequalis]